jgi:hypothetical protein
MADHETLVGHAVAVHGRGGGWGVKHLSFTNFLVGDHTGDVENLNLNLRF